MQHKSRLFILAVLLSIVSAPSPVFCAETRSARLVVDLPPGIEKSVRLRKLPKATRLSIHIQCKGEIWTRFVDVPNYAVRGSDACRPLFSSQVKKKLNFSLTIPQKGDYFILFKNTSGRHHQSVDVSIDASHSLTEPLDTANAILKQFENGLHQLFIFDGFDFAIKPCNRRRDFAAAAGVIVCTEYLALLQEIFPDRKMANDALAISVFLKIGGELEESWGLPPDQLKKEPEFPVVLMIMLNLTDMIQSFCDQIIADPSSVHTLSRELGNHQTPFSKTQAQLYLGWIRDPDFARKWQKRIVPHMQTRFLKRLNNQPTAWTDMAAVEEELARREKSHI